MIDIETASRSIDIVIGIALLAVVTTWFLTWVWCGQECKKQKIKTQQAVSKAVQETRNECHNELVQKGAKQFSETMRLKKIIKEQESKIARLTGENKRMTSILERVSR